MFASRRWSTVLRLLGVLAALVSVVLAVALVLNARRQQAALQGQMRARRGLQLQAAREHVERFLGEIELCVSLIAGEPSIRQMSEASREYVDYVYRMNYARHRLAEVYVIERGFDGRRRPYMTFELADDAAAAEVHSLEREAAEYAVHVRQLERFEREPELSILLDGPVPLCVGEPGLVCSVPIRVAGRLVGMVAGMFTLRSLSEVIEGSSAGNRLLLVADSGALVGCPHFPPAARAWFAARVGNGAASSFFAGLPESFTAGAFTALWTRPQVPGGGVWYAVSLHDEAAEQGAYGWPGTARTVSGAALLVLLGAAVLVLCRVTPSLALARRESDARARALLISEERLEAVVNNTVAVIYTKDREGRYLLINRRFEELFRVTRAEVVGKTDFDLFPPEAARAYRANDERVLAAGQPLEFEEVAAHADGPHTYISLKFPLYGGQARPEAVCAISTDITGRIRAEVHKREQEARLEQIGRVATLGEMSARLAHEVNQPLAAIANYLHAALGRIRAGGPETAELRVDLEQAAAQAERAGHIIQAVRDFARRRSPARACVQINELITEAAALVQHEARQRQIRIDLALGAVPPIWAAGVQIQQVLVNLIRNGLDAMAETPADGRCLTIASRTEADRVQVDVCDQGHGLADVVSQNLYRAFVTTKAEGMGLGLPISRSIIEAHGGRLWYTRNKRAGLTFHFELPVTRGEAEDAGSSRSHRG
ncbi:MAG: PAS domain-containing protein [Planctomycetota bacterium]